MRGGSRLTKYEYRDSRASTPGAGQVGGRDQAVMPAADHHNVDIRSRIGGHGSASQISQPDVDSREHIRVSEFLGLCHGSSVRF